MTERTGVIYKATILPTGKSYIGLTLHFENRKISHLCSKEDGLFQRSIRKHGADAVAWRILADDIPQAQLPTAERFWIRFYDTYTNGLNMTEGGDVSPLTNPEVASRVGKKNSARMLEESARGELPIQQPEVQSRISATKKAQSERGELPVQQPKVKAQISETLRKKGERGELPMQQPEVKAEIRNRGERGELPCQQPEARERTRQRMLEASERGENPMQQPHIVRRAHRNRANSQAAKRADAGQQFWCEITITPPTEES